MIQHDPIFEQHYRKKVDAQLQRAYESGVNQGINNVLAVAAKLSNNGNTLISYEMLIKTLIASFHAHQEGAQEPEAVAKLEDAPAPEKKRPTLEVVK